MRRVFRLALYFTFCGVYCIIIVYTVWVQSRPKPQPPLPPSEPDEILVSDLPDELQEQIKKLFHDAIVNSIPADVKAGLDEFQKIDDPIERRLLDHYDRLVDVPDGGNALYSIYLVKPGKEKKTVRFLQVKDRQIRVFIRYTCVAAKVAEPIAYLSVIQLAGPEPAVTEKVVFYHPETGWEPGPAEKENPKGSGAASPK